MIILVLGLLHCTMNNELCNLSPFFLKKFPCRAPTQSDCNLLYKYEYQFGGKIIFLRVSICGMIVACINLCINEAMRRQAAYRLAWDQRIERDQLQKSDNIIKGKSTLVQFNLPPQKCIQYFPGHT